MKKSWLKRPFKHTLLAVPACALMLGAAQAGTTIGVNFAAWYYDSGNTPQTIGFGFGYQTTGFQVTAKAFGIPATNWYGTLSPNLLNGGWVAMDSTYTFGPGGALSAQMVAPGGATTCIYQTGIGQPSSGWVPQIVAPGNDQVTWNCLNNDGVTYPSVFLRNLATSRVFPNGYAVQTISAYDRVYGLSDVSITDAITATNVAYKTYYRAPNPGGDSGYRTGGGTIGLSGLSGTWTNDTLQLNCTAQAAGSFSGMAGFIITDQPVVTHSYPASVVVGVGGSFVLSASVVGIETLSYQWQKENPASPGTFTDVPGATFLNYTNSAAAEADSGSYRVVVTGSLFPSSPATGDVIPVTVVPQHAPRAAIWDGDALVTGAQDGSGTWSYALVNWWSGSVDDYWNDTDSAVFGMGGAGPYTVTLNNSLKATGLTFNSGGYTIASSGQTLTLETNGTTATITANAAATISSPLSTTNILLKDGTGALTLSGALGSASTFINAGTLEVGARNGDSPYTITNGATLKLGYTTGGGYANTRLMVYGDGTAATTGLYLAGGQSYCGSGQIQLLNAPTTIRQYGTGLAGIGMFDINGIALWCTAAASGSIIDSNVQMISRGYGMSARIDAGANSATGDLVINGPLNVSSLGFLKQGEGSLRLNATATESNTLLSVLGGSVICGTADCVGANATLNVGTTTIGAIAPVAGTVFDFNGYSQTVSNVALGGGTLKMTIRTGGAPSADVLRTTDPNTPLSYGGSLTVTSVGSAPTLGQKFTLFNSASGYGGWFTNINLPTFAQLAWDTSGLFVDGSITVVAGAVPPTIVTDLCGTTNYASIGGSISFAITATGDPTLRYQWKKNGTTPVGTDSPTLTLSPLTVSDSGYYSVTVTNAFGTSQSLSNYLLVSAADLLRSHVMADSPWAYWPLNEGCPSTIAYDYAGGQRNGAALGYYTLGADGPRPPGYNGFSPNKTAYLFDGGTAFINCGTGASLSGTTDFTLEAWINTTEGTRQSTVLAQRDDYNGEYILAINPNGTVYFLVFGGGNWQFEFNSPTDKVVNDGAWHHIVAVRSGVNGIIYIDGSAVTNKAGSFVAPLDPSFRVAIGSDHRAIAFGQNQFFNGALCDVAIYNYALSSARIADHATFGIVGGPLVLSRNADQLTWQLGILESSPTLAPTPAWQTVIGATSPYTITPTNSSMFYRLRL